MARFNRLAIHKRREEMELAGFLWGPDGINGMIYIVKVGDRWQPKIKFDWEPIEKEIGTFDNPNDCRKAIYDAMAKYFPRWG
jgi:hypothetical protein